MKKNILVLIMLLLCFGCKANYDLIINENLSVVESISALEDDNYYNIFLTSKSDVVRNVLYSVNEFLNNQDYNFEEVEEGTLYGGKISKNYVSLNDFYTNSKVYLQYFKDFNYENDNGIITISLNDKVKWDGANLERYIIDDGSVSITLPFKVLEHNADSYYNGKYTWNINSKDDKTIHIKFDSTKKFDNNALNIKIIMGFVLFIIIVAVIIFYVYKKKSETRNEI